MTDDTRYPAETPVEDQPSGGVTRRRALQVLAAGAAGAAALSTGACSPGDETSSPTSGPETGAGAGTPRGGNRLAAGTATDPDLVAPIVPWDLVLSDDELETLAALCDVIIPEDDHSPGAAALGAHEFIDEWVSAPYDGNRNDLVQIRGGISWLNRESRRRFDGDFAALTLDQKHLICDDICYEPDAAREFRSAARFFDRVRDLTSSAFWTTEEGMADLGFVGNRALPAFEGPPQEVLERLGLV